MPYRVNCLLKLKGDWNGDLSAVHAIAVDDLPPGVSFSILTGDVHYTFTGSSREIEKLLCQFIGPLCVRYLNAIESVAVTWKLLESKGGESL